MLATLAHWSLSRRDACPQRYTVPPVCAQVLTLQDLWIGAPCRSHADGERECLPVLLRRPGHPRPKRKLKPDIQSRAQCQKSTSIWAQVHRRPRLRSTAVKMARRLREVAGDLLGSAALRHSVEDGHVEPWLWPHRSEVVATLEELRFAVEMLGARPRQAPGGRLPESLG